MAPALLVQDMRHRLAADGSRYGKVIAYKMSELRMDALLTTLCDEELTQYQWVEATPKGDSILPGPRRRLPVRHSAVM